MAHGAGFKQQRPQRVTAAVDRIELDRFALRITVTKGLRRIYFREF